MNSNCNSLPVRHRPDILRHTTVTRFLCKELMFSTLKCAKHTKANPNETPMAILIIGILAAQCTVHL